MIAHMGFLANAGEECATHILAEHLEAASVSVAVLIPCKNEALTIKTVIEGFRRAIPHAQIWVCDNLSTDATASEALLAGASVVTETRPGKGHAVWRLFATVDADVYVLVDGDGTYDVGSVANMIDVLLTER